MKRIKVSRTAGIKGGKRIEVLKENPFLRVVWEPGVRPAETLKQLGHVLTTVMVFLYVIRISLGVTVGRDRQIFIKEKGNGTNSTRQNYLRK